jgi:D-lactate dehydrogenase (cytochrome)
MLPVLESLMGERLSVKASVLEEHGHDESYHPTAPPDAVVFPLTTEEVAAVVALCNQRGVAVIPYGTGTSLEGGVAALRGGVCIDLSRMDQVVEINTADLDCTVQAGVTRRQLNTYLRYTGLFFPVDPGADASLGGMAATRASGTNAVRYGTMRDLVLGLRVVLADGSVIRTGGRARKSAAGYDLTRLFVGSEGTLGVITEVTLRLFGLPEAMSAAVCRFDSLAGAVDTVIQTVQLGVPVARIELLDELMLDAINRWSKTAYALEPTLFFEFHGTRAAVEEQTSIVQGLAAENGGRGFESATDEGERERLWRARHDAYYAALALRPGAKGWPTDVCVPISRLADCILETRRDLAGTRLVAPLVGHAGDGNFHLVYVLDPDDPAELAEAEAFNGRLVRRALAMGGTCTGEHGVGYGKVDFLAEEHGHGALQAMASIKRALDPKNILNPGKVVRV